MRQRKVSGAEWGENEEKGAEVGEEGRGTRRVERGREAPRDLSPDCLWPYSL
jgi:hypothetical protein